MPCRPALIELFAFAIEALFFAAWFARLCCWYRFASAFAIGVAVSMTACCPACTPSVELLSPRAFDACAAFVAAVCISGES